MNYPLLHDATFDVLYGCAGLLAFVIIERALYFAYLSVRSARLARELSAPRQSGAAHRPGELRDPINRAVGRYLDTVGHPGVTRDHLEDVSAALYIELDKQVSARLWLLETIVTAAPLLGLLGTIFGIMQTFTALAQGAVSDPTEVSRGIGLALTATAVGITVAVVGLVGHTALNRRAHLLTENFKIFVLRLTPGNP